MTEPYLPADIIFHPNWWHKNYGLTFDRDFFYDPTRRVNQEQQMRQLLYERFGDLGLGCRFTQFSQSVGCTYLIYNLGKKCN